MTVLSFPDPRGAPDARALPSNVEAEQAVLGACLINNAVAASLRLEPDHFSEEIHRRIWEVMQALLKDGKAVTPTVLKTYLGDREMAPGMIVPQYLARLMVESSSPLLAATYAREIVDLHARRKFITMIGEAVEQAYDPPVDLPVGRILDGAEEAVQAIRLASPINVSVRIHAGNAAESLLDEVQRMMDGEQTSAGVTTGLRDLDYDTGGMRPGELWVVAGRVGMGKSIKATTLARSAARSGSGVLMFPFENGWKQATARVLSDLSYLHSRPLGYGAIMKANELNSEDMWRLRDAQKRLAAMPLVFDQSSGATLTQIASRVRAERDRMSKAGVKLSVVILDYLKYIKASDRYSGQRVNEVGEITVGLKRMAQDLDVCVVLLAQVNRNTEARDDKRPGLADLRESGDIESDADVVMFVYRDIYYIETSKKFKDGDPDTVSRANDCRDELELIVAKLRTGATRTHKLWCDVSCSTIAAQSRGGI